MDRRRPPPPHPPSFDPQVLDCAVVGAVIERARDTSILSELQLNSAEQKLFALLLGRHPMEQLLALDFMHLSLNGVRSILLNLPAVEACAFV